MRTLFILAIAINFLCSPTLVCSQSENSDSENRRSFKVGVILPLSGDYVFVGNEIQRGMELARSDFPALDLEIIYEDEQTFVSKAATSAAKKLAQINKVDIVFNTVVNTTHAIAPVLGKAGIPEVILWDSNDKLRSLGEHVFSIGFSTEAAGIAMAEHAYRNLKLRTISVVSTHDEWSEIISEAFITRFKALGGTIDLHQQVNVDASDMRTIVARIKSKNSDSVYIPLFLQSLSAFISQSGQLHYPGKILSADGFTNNELAMLGRNANGIDLTQLWTNAPELSEKYKAKFGSDTDAVSLSFSALGYDAVQLLNELARAMDQQKLASSRAEILKLLPSVSFNGYTGKTSFNKHRMAAKVMPIITIKNQTFQRVSSGD